MQSLFLLLYSTAHLDHLCVAEYKPNKKFVVRHRPDELESFRQTAQVGLQQLGRRAALTTSEIRRRQLKVAAVDWPFCTGWSHFVWSSGCKHTLFPHLHCSLGFARGN
jgi:hypothetical protein